MHASLIKDAGPEKLFTGWKLNIKHDKFCNALLLSWMHKQLWCSEIKMPDLTEPAVFTSNTFLVSNTSRERLDKVSKTDDLFHFLCFSSSLLTQTDNHFIVQDCWEKWVRRKSWLESLTFFFLKSCLVLVLLSCGIFNPAHFFIKGVRFQSSVLSLHSVKHHKGNKSLSLW